MTNAANTVWNTETVYGIYYGCIHEGGSVNPTLYKNYDDAHNAALKMIEKKEKDLKIIQEVWEKEGDHFHMEDKWEQDGKDYWSNGSDCIIVEKFSVK